MTRVSVIILNYKRPHNIYKLVPELLKFEEIDDIIISHGDIDNVIKINHPKVVNIYDWDINDKYYTFLKFKNYVFAKNKCVLLLDDDIYPSRELFYNMLNNYNKNKLGLYGPSYRVCGNTYETFNNYNDRYRYIKYVIFIVVLINIMCICNKYHSKIIVCLSIIFMIILYISCFNKKVIPNTILTNICMVNKEVINNIWNHISTPKYKHLYNIVINNKGNGEDLLFNHVYRKLYSNPTYVFGEVNKLDTSDGFSTVNNKDHINYRKNFCKILINYNK
jgi:hypothetical protein